MKRGINHSLRSLHQLLDRHFLSSNQQVMLVGGIIFAAYLLIYWGWTGFYPQPYESFWLRLIATILSFGLIWLPYWPAAFNAYAPWYWFFTLLFTLPFFFTYSFLMNHANDLSSMALLCGIFLLVLIVDLTMLLALLLLGMGCAFVSYYFSVTSFYMGNEHVEALFVMLFLIIAGSSVNYKKAVLQQQRLRGMAAAAGMIAHELRTPLLSMKSGAQALEQYMPLIFEGYQKAKQQGLLTTNIRKHREQQLQSVSSRIVREIDYANTMIDMLLMKSGRGQSLQHYPLDVTSMADCIKEALKRYPFSSQEQRKLVQFEGDFYFMGSQILMQHVFFNLLKNAFYAIANAQRGDIRIWCESRANKQVLFFKDTAKGMSRKQLSLLFEDFFTDTFMGTGIGLSFCKLVMKRFGGEITCRAEEGKYTLFILTFPRLKM